MTVSPVLLRQAIRGGPPTGGFADDGFLRAAILGQYIPAIDGGVTPATPPEVVTYDMRGMYNRLAVLGGVKCIMGYAASAQASWPDLIGGEDMTAFNDSNFNGKFVSFDGENDYWTTDGAAAWQTDFAGPTDQSVPNTWNSSGITISCLMRVQPGDLGNRTLCHWFNGGASGDNYCRWLLRFWQATGGETMADSSTAVAGGVYLQFWNAYGALGLAAVGDDRAPYLDPVAGTIEGEPGDGTQADPAVPDRFFTIPVNLNPFLTDGRWHLFQFARGTTGSVAEKKLMAIDGRTVYNAGTGNGINGFTDFTVAITVGKTETTTIASDAAIQWANFKGDIAMFAVRNRWTTEAEMRQVFAAAAGNSGIRSSTRYSRGR